MDEINFDDLCELAARAGQARTAVITRLDRKKGTLEVLGRYGTAKNYSPNVALPLLDPDKMPIMAVPDVSQEPAFVGHPLTKFVPTIHSLIAAILKSRGNIERTTLTVLNPSKDVFDDADAFACLSKLVMVYRQLLNGVEAQETAAVKTLLAETKPAGFQEASSAIEPAAKFLVDTLLHKQSLRSRNATSFVSLRTWRKSIKEHQIAALVAIKKNPHPSFVDAVAEEIAKAARHLYGDRAIGTVVPIPGGSSGSGPCLSELLGQEVAKKLNCQCIRALAAGPVERGGSHPKKSGRLAPYSVTETVTGMTLIVDDVVTSGRHFELAQTALRTSGATCVAIAWIGT